MTTDTSGGAAKLRRRIEALEAEKIELERQLSDQARRTNAAIAAAQDKTYWLDRWQLDLNQAMTRPSGTAFRAVLRGVRTVMYPVRRARRRLSR